MHIVNNHKEKQLQQLTWLDNDSFIFSGYDDITDSDQSRVMEPPHLYPHPRRGRQKPAVTATDKTVKHMVERKFFAIFSKVFWLKRMKDI